MANLTVHEKLVYAKSRLLIRHRLFGILSLDFPLKEAVGRPDITTMGTDNVNIYYYKPFIEKLTKNQVMTVLLHELLHISFKHFMRFKLQNIKNQDDHKQTNMALDYAINSIILNEMAPRDNLLEFPAGALYDERFKGMNAEKILEFLKKEKKDKPQQSQQREQQAYGGEGFGQFDNHDASSDMTGQTINQNKKLGKSTQDQMNDIDKKIFKASSGLNQKEKGDVPSDMQRLIDEYLEELEGHIDWKRFIKRKIQEIGRGQYTTSRVNRAYLPYNLYLPGQTGSKAKVALALDTSGSISNDDIVEFLVELRSMLRVMPFLEVKLYGCDAEIHGKATIKGIKNFRKDVSKVLTGGGGTSFIPVFKDLAEGKDKDIKCLFYFTDGYGDQDHIEQVVGKCKWDTFWVVGKDNKDRQFPFGRKIVIWDKKNGEE